MASPNDNPPVGNDPHDANPAAEAAEGVHGHEVPAGTAHVADHGGEGGGLPQFEFEYWGGQIVWLLLIFTVLYFLFSKVFVPRYRRVVETRTETIEGALAQARQVQTEADAQAEAAKAEIDEGRARARRLAADAQTKATADLQARLAAEDQRLAAEMSEAETRIRQMRDQAMTHVQGIAGDAAQAMVEKLTGKPLSADEAKALQGAA